MDETTTTTIDLIPKALERVYDQLDELRILTMLEESEREAEAGHFLTLEECFESLRTRLRQLHNQENNFQENAFPEVKANAV